MGEKVYEKCAYDVVGTTQKVGLGKRHIQIILMCFVATVLYVVRSGMSVAIIAMTDEHHPKGVTVYPWDKKIQDMLLSSFFWGYMMAQIPAGVLAKKFGPKPLLLIALLVNGTLCLILPWAISIGGWYAGCAARVCMGLTQGCLFPSVHTLLSKWVPTNERSSLGNIAYSGVQIGTIVSLPLCGILSDTSYGWPLIFMCMGGLSYCAAIIWYIFARNSPQQHKYISEREKHYIQNSLKTDDRCLAIPWKSIFTSLPMWALLCSHIGVNWAFIIMFLETPTYMNQIFKFDAKQSGMYSALPFAMAWLMSLIFSKVCDMLYDKNYMSVGMARKLFNSIGCFGTAIGLASLSFINSTALALAMLTMTMGLFSASMSGFMMNHMDLAPNFAGIMLGITNGVANAFGNIAPLTVGVILGENHSADVTRWRIVFFVAAAIVSVGNIVFVMFGSGETQPWNDIGDTTRYKDIEMNESLKEALKKRESLRSGVDARYNKSEKI